MVQPKGCNHEGPSWHERVVTVTRTGVAISESPGIGRAGGHGYLGCGGGWPYLHEDESIRGENTKRLQPSGCRTPRHSKIHPDGYKSLLCLSLDHTQMSQPGAAPAEVEVLATGVGPG
jgi:hypothetical protein